MTIKAKLLQASKSVYTNAIAYTFELEYPRFIHAEVMTHRMASKNSASSRAIPVAKMLEQIEEDTAMPIHWGKNQAGMQAKEELSEKDKEYVKATWYTARNAACNFAEVMSQAGAHKQIVNRIVEPFQHMKVVFTATDLNNFFWLRNHPDAQPEIRELARLMYEEVQSNEPMLLKDGELHVPYVERKTGKFHDLDYYVGQERLTPEEAIKVSASLCAQVSYRKADFSLQKAIDIYDRLVGSEPAHASPFEHQLICKDTPTSVEEFIGQRESGNWTHLDCNGHYYSGNIRGFVQYRQTIPNNAKRY